MMKKIMVFGFILMVSGSVFAKEYIVKEVSNPGAEHPFIFEPASLTIAIGDTVSFVNAQDEMHNVMFDSVPLAVTDMIMSPMLQKKGEKWSYTFSVPGSYHFHCHPHEALGMTGSLIVGTASKEGESKNVDHDEMHQEMDHDDEQGKDDGHKLHHHSWKH